ncbi:NACHT domain-containing protein [Nannocystis sp. ILAH1]|uniref:NACHT domain-containing protein n=1 Tax=Nannocystis sp. ILAH1 TaxID=2996789 RepID=UPI00226FE089|nr:NACHT domain-containing protein [Nannocystis sp. ILAH1]MCY0987928.1 NACHT domain-containing protein [Nannocystis sp. ILAH1]
MSRTNERDGKQLETLRIREVLADAVLGRQDIPSILQITLACHYTELEAEVEAEGDYVARKWSVRDRVPGNQLRVEPSLTAAIERSRERFILLEGDPGSGKTVSLRKVEKNFATQIRQDPHCPLPLPLYVNLKYISPGDGQALDKLRTCILRALHSDPAVASARFSDGCRHGGWLLLLDSFDEIPDVLSAIEADSAVQSYVSAIQDFCTDINLVAATNCRVLVASRSYRGPRVVNWSRFHLRPLTEDRRRVFLANCGLDTEQVRRLSEDLVTAPPGWAHNPLTLSMLCELSKAGEPFPPNVYTLFDKYLNLRFNRDAGRVREIYGGGVDELRRSAEEIAFVMWAEPSLGQVPSNRAVSAALLKFDRPAVNVDRVLETIQQLELALSEDQADGAHTHFRHRRLQEYFATRVIVREPELLSPDLLLFDGRWREACVVLLQHSPVERLTGVLAAAERFVLACHAEMGFAAEDFAVASPIEEARERTTGFLKSAPPPRPLVWPKNLYHVMDLLQCGYACRRDLPQTLQQSATSLLVQAYRAGIRMDKVYVLELAGVLPPGHLEGLALTALDGDSELLHDVAFKQLPRVSRPSIEVLNRIERLLYRMTVNGRIAQDRLATEARLRRMDHPALVTLFASAASFYEVENILRVILAAGFFIGLSLVVATSSLSPGESVAVLVTGLLVSALVLWIVQKYRGQAILFLVTLIGSLPLTIAVLESVGKGTADVILVTCIYAEVCIFSIRATLQLGLPIPRFLWPFTPVLLIIFSTAALVLNPKVLMWILALAGVGVGVKYLSAQQVMPDWLDDLFGIPFLLLLVLLGGMAGVAALRESGLAVRDLLTQRSMDRHGPHELTIANLQDHLARFRTSRGRIGMLRSVMNEREGGFTLLAFDRAMYGELEAFVGALEVHAHHARRTSSGFLSSRLHFSPDYVDSCTSAQQKWCLKHCSTVDTIADLSIILDLLTQLLAHVAKSMASEKSGSGAALERIDGSDGAPLAVSST